MYFDIKNMYYQWLTMFTGSYGDVHLVAHFAHVRSHKIQYENISFDSGDTYNFVLMCASSGG